MSSQWRQLSPACPAGAASKDTPLVTWHNTHTHKFHHRLFTMTNTYVVTQFHQSAQTRKLHLNRHSNTSAIMHISPEGLRLWKTWGITGAKDGRRQQLLVPRYGSVPKANPLISALHNHRLLPRGSTHTHSPEVS